MTRQEKISRALQDWSDLKMGRPVILAPGDLKRIRAARQEHAKLNRWRRLIVRMARWMLAPRG